MALVFARIPAADPRAESWAAPAGTARFVLTRPPSRADYVLTFYGGRSSAGFRVGRFNSRADGFGHAAALATAYAARKALAPA